MLTQSRLQDLLLQLWRSSPAVHPIPILDVSLVPTRVLDELAEAETTIERLQNQLQAQERQIQQRQQLLLSLQKAQVDLRDAVTDLEQERILRRYQNGAAMEEMKTVEAMAMRKCAEMEVREVNAGRLLDRYLSQAVKEEINRSKEMLELKQKAQEEKKRYKEALEKLQEQLLEAQGKQENYGAQGDEESRKVAVQEGGGDISQRKNRYFATAKALVAKSASGNRCLLFRALLPSVDLPNMINDIAGAKVELLRCSKWTSAEVFVQFLHENDAENYLHMVTTNPTILGTGIEVRYGAAIAPLKKELANEIITTKATRIIRIYGLPLDISPLRCFPFMELVGGSFRHVKMMGTAYDTHDIQLEFSSTTLAIAATKKISQDAYFGKFETRFVANEVDAAVEKHVLACMGRGVKILLPAA